jgi:hypothetical protein
MKTLCANAAVGPIGTNSKLSSDPSFACKASGRVRM